MAPPLEQFFVAGIGTELIYSFIIIVCSLMIYFGTKKLYELSSHKGIEYFRMAFLFFALAYFFRSIIKFILVFFDIRVVFEFSPIFFGPVTVFLFTYSSFMAIFYLLYSVMWKKWNGNSKKIYWFHAAAIILSLVNIISRTNVILLGINIFFVLLISFIFYMKHKEFRDKKKGYNLYAIYMLLFIFLLLNIIEVLIPPFLQQFQLIIYLISTGIFLTILYKVLKKIGN